jgi:hypothetical protein
MRLDPKLVGVGLACLVGALSAGVSPALSDGYVVRPVLRHPAKPIVIRRVAKPGTWCRWQAWNLYKFDRRTRGGALASWDDQRIAASVRSDFYGICGGYWRPRNRWSYR